MDKRITALRRFAIAITVLNILGHSILGFEQSILQVIVCLGTAYSLEITFEIIKAKLHNKKMEFLGSVQKFIDFLLPAHISALAIAMLLYANETLLPYIFAVSVAIGSKEIFKAPLKNKYRHFFNPSNTGIAVTLFLFPWVGIAPPYQFTENVTGAWDWVIPGIILFTGSLLNATLTNRIPLVLGWTFAFAAQGILRYFVFDSTNFAAIFPLTGMAFVLFTFYMITDPGTTPSSKRNQFIFGGSVALMYGLLVVLNVVYTFFFALVTVCAIRGMYLYTIHFIQKASKKVDLNNNTSPIMKEVA